MPDHLRLSTQLEPSTSKGSMIRTDANNKQEYFAPSGADEYLVSVDLGGGHYRPEWTSVPTAFTCSDLNSCSIDDLSDVTITTPASGNIMYYNGSAWVNATFASRLATGSLGDLSDVDLTGLANTQGIAYNSGTGNFEPSSFATALNIAGDSGSGTVGISEPPDTFTVTGITPGISTTAVLKQVRISLSRNKEYFTPPAAATVVTLTGDCPATGNAVFLDVYRNGVYQTITTHYTYDGTAKTITFLTSFDGIEDVQAVYFTEP